MEMGVTETGDGATRHPVSSTPDRPMRDLKVWRAFLASVAGLGLGYLYVGSVRLAFAVPLAVVSVFAFAGWTRLILQPSGMIPIAVVALGTALVPLVHAMGIAWSRKRAPESPLNRWWVYCIWIASSVMLGNVLSDNRASFFGFEPFRIPSASMSPTLQPGDLIMTDTWRLRSEDPDYGDLVVFDVPDGGGVKYVFRVVGRPGDRIEIRDAVLYRNGQSVPEPYLNGDDFAMSFSRNIDPVELGPSSFFMLGDNRDNARDSRFVGPVDRGLLHGRVEYRWFAYDDGIRWDRFPELLVNERN